MMFCAWNNVFLLVLENFGYKNHFFKLFKKVKAWILGI
jgi:hypothetical protein